MKRAKWIVCERTNRWAAALRQAWDREYAAGDAPPRLVETRNLADAAAALESATDSFLAIEVRPQNLAEILPWLAKLSELYPQARLVALADASFNEPLDLDGDQNVHPFEFVSAALCEAGAQHVARSPRSLGPVLQIAQRHFQTQMPQNAAANSSPIERVWDSLPWQAG